MSPFFSSLTHALAHTHTHVNTHTHTYTHTHTHTCTCAHLGMNKVSLGGFSDGLDARPALNPKTLHLTLATLNLYL